MDDQTLLKKGILERIQLVTGCEYPPVVTWGNVKDELIPD